MSILEKSGKFALFFTQYVSDAGTYFKYCGISPFQDRNKKLFYKILIEAHALEKGLSLATPRPLFGEAKIRFLMNALKRYDISESRLPAEMTCGVLHAYLDLHAALTVEGPLLEEVGRFVAAYEAETGIIPNGGLRDLAAESKVPTDSPSAFIAARHSVRMFTEAYLDRATLEEIVTLAQSAPSQCNRQSSKAYFYQNRSDIDALLALQSGAKGFSRDVNNLFVVTSDLAAWGGAQQRNQAYVDGALFAMTLMLACHAKGLGACPLNLAIVHKTERQIKQTGKIGEDERLIMMIAVGYPKVSGQLKVARSPRRDVSEILQAKLVED